MKKQLRTMLLSGKSMAIAILCVLMGAGFVSNAQIASYGRTVLSGLTYTPISGGTVINSNAQLTGLGLSDDDGGLAVTLPFTFTYDNTAYTTVTFCTNGWVGMGNQTALSAAQGRASSSLFTTTVPNSTIGAWFGDGNANWTTGGGSIVHGSIGTDVYAFEWRNASGSGFSNSTTIRINYMIVLYGPASGTPGRIELLYGATTGAISVSRTIGIEDAIGGNTHYINAITGLTTGSTTTAAAWPGNGNGYRFDPATAITLQPADANDCSGSNVVFNVNANYTATAYQWQESTNGGATWANVANGGVYTNVTTSTMTLVGITSGMNNYRYRCFVTGNGSATSNGAILTVDGAPSIATNPINQTACEGSSSGFTVVPGGGAGITYQWQQNAGLGFVNLTNTGIYSGVNATTLNISAVTTSMGGYQYRCILSKTCGLNTNSTVTTYAALTVLFKPVVTSNPLNVTTCSGTNTSFTVQGTGTALVYQWQLSTDGGATYGNLTNGAPYAGVTTTTLALTGVTLGMHNYRYRVEIAGSCTPAVQSTGAILSVFDNPVITTQPSAASVCATGNTSFSVVASGAANTYQWQVNSGGGFVNVTNTGVYTGAATATLTLTGVLANMQNYQYRCMITSGCNATGVFTSAVVLTVFQQPAVTQQPTAVTVCEGGNAGFTIIGSGTSAGYTWQESTNGGVTYTNLTNGGLYSNVFTGSLTLTGVTASMNNYRYRCVVNGFCTPDAISNAVILTVNTSPAITSSPGNRTICVGGSASFAVTATGTGLTYLWQVNTGSGFTNISNGGFYSNATTATLTVSGATTAINGAEYRCVVSGTCSSPAVSTGGILTVNAPIAITTQPVNATVCNNSYTSFSVVVTGTNPVYTWQESTNGGVTWNNISATAIYALNGNILNLNLPPASMNNYRYRCLISGTCTGVPVTSGQGILTVNSAPAITGQSGTNIIQCAGTSTVMSVTASATGIQYQWQESQNGGVTWNNLINGAPYLNVTTASMTLSATPATLNGFLYRCYVSGTCAPGVLSSPVNLTVNTLPAITLQPLSSTLCAGGNTSFTVGATGTNIVYQWQLSINSGGTWSNLANNFQYSGINTTTLNITGVTASMTNYYYRCYVSGYCAPAVVSSSAILTIQTPPSLTSQPVDRTLCEGSGTTFATSATGTSVVYTWQESRNGGASWANLTAATPYSNVATATLTVSPVTAAMNGYLYRCYVTGTCTPPVTTFVGKLTVWTAPVIVSQTSSVQACPGVATNMSVSMTGSNLVYQWQMNAGLGYVAVPTSSIYSGMNTAILSISSPSSLQNGYVFRCIISGSCGSPVTSSPIVLTVYKPVDIVYNPATATVCVGGSQYLAIKALGNNLVYQWQEKVNGVYVNLQNVPPYSNTTADTMWISDAQDTLNGKIYRCVVTEYTLCNQLYYSNEITLKVNAPIQTDPSSINVTKWGVAKFNVPAGGLSYQWQEDKGSGFNNLAEGFPYLGTQTATLRINPLSVTMSGYRYRCIVDGICVTSTTSLPSTLTVTAGTGIAQQQGGKVNYLSVYPNPVTGNSLQVKFETAVKGETVVKIMDKLGREVYSNKLTLEQGVTGSVEVGELATGVYTLHVINTTEEINTSVRFTKQ